jgi:hypothetical protein
MEEQPSPVQVLAERLGKRWPHIDAARDLARAKLSELRALFPDSDSEDTSIVVVGSLGREEFTTGSDIDWNLVADGIANPNHHTLFVDARRKIAQVTPKREGREGTFGGFVSSHDLIHLIGGEDDTNRNTTRRLLLLLESAPVGGKVAYERVVKNILTRYLLEDRGFWRGSQDGLHIPHFLLNDFARLWRTIAVDFAYKLRDRSGDGWAIRNIKLRMSRKLLYVAALLACYSVDLRGAAAAAQRTRPKYDFRPLAVEVLDKHFRLTPLGIVANFLLIHEHLRETASRMFGAYDGFLAILSNEDKRKHLENLSEGDADSDGIYQEARNLSHEFRDAVLDLFFDEKSGLNTLTRLYGIF